MAKDYTVRMTFEDGINAPNKTVAEQAARKTARSMDRDAANKHIDLANVDVEETRS